jgi:O-antigen ligase
MEKIAAIILFLVFPFGQLLRFDLGDGITVHMNDLVVGGMGLVGLMRFMRIRDELKKPLVVWVLIAGFSLALNFHLVGLLYLIRWVAYAGLYFFFKDFKEKDFLKKGLQLAILAVAVVGLGQYLFLPDTTFLAASNWDDHSFRLLSTFLDPGFAGIILVLGILGGLGGFGGLGITYSAMMMAYSRASYLAYLVGITAVSFYRKSWKLFAVAVMIFVLTVSLLPKSYGESTNLKRENSFWARVHNWQQAVDIWQKNPILGVGFGNYQYYSGANIESHAKAGSDSSILTVLATTGGLGLLGYLGVMRGMWVMGRKNLIFKAGFLAIFVHSWFNNTLFYPWAMEWLWLTLAASNE